MKLYSDILTGTDYSAAVRAATSVSVSRGKGNIGTEKFDTLKNTRVRKHGVDVLLYRSDSWRPFATGTRGAGNHGAASWSDWGWFLSCLYERDPNARLGPYKGREDFHARTQNAYMGMTGWGELGTVHYMESGNPRVTLAECGTCGRIWNDDLGSSLTPAPAGRCPYEYEHTHEDATV